MKLNSEFKTRKASWWGWGGGGLIGGLYLHVLFFSVQVDVPTTREGVLVKWGAFTILRGLLLSSSGNISPMSSAAQHNAPSDLVPITMIIPILTFP